MMDYEAAIKALRETEEKELEIMRQWREDRDR